MDISSKQMFREVAPGAPSRQPSRKNPVDYWPLAILLERAAYLRKLAALGDGSASETLKEYPQHSAMLCFRSRTGNAELHQNFATLLHILDGRATLLTGGVIAAAQPIAGCTKQEMRAGDVLHIPAGQPHQILVAGDKTVTYLVMKIQETP